MKIDKDTEKLLVDAAYKAYGEFVQNHPVALKAIKEKKLLTDEEIAVYANMLEVMAESRMEAHNAAEDDAYEFAAKVVRSLQKTDEEKIRMEVEKIRKIIKEQGKRS